MREILLLYRVRQGDIPLEVLKLHCVVPLFRSTLHLHEGIFSAAIIVVSRT